MVKLTWCKYYLISVVAISTIEREILQRRKTMYTFLAIRYATHKLKRAPLNFLNCCLIDLWGKYKWYKLLSTLRFFNCVLVITLEKYWWRSILQLWLITIYSFINILLFWNVKSPTQPYSQCPMVYPMNTKIEKLSISDVLKAIIEIAANNIITIKMTKCIFEKIMVADLQIKIGNRNVLRRK